MFLKINNKGNLSGGKGVCSGDSGGPLYYLEPSTNKYVLAGVISFTNSAGCGLSGAQKLVFLKK
jgi:secreted trypsin-like serine protease